MIHTSSKTNLPIRELHRLVDPLDFGKIFWPHISFYKEQKEFIYSVENNAETYVPAGNMMGKDFGAGFVNLSFFLRRHPVRVVTTSVDETQLEGVLWGEIRRLIQTCKYKLAHTQGGPLVINHVHLRKMVGFDKGAPELDALSYMIGRVAKRGEGMLGHHIADTGDGIPRTLFTADEASGVETISYERATTWAKRILVIGNCFPCENFFKEYTEEGDKYLEDGKCYRKVIRIKCSQSPNVRLALAQIKKGQKPTNEVLIPGVLPYPEYTIRRETWDEVRQCVGLDAEFWKGKDALMYPPQWLNRAELIAEKLKGRLREAKVIGIDTGEGVANTVMTAVDEYGIIEQISLKTPDTSVIGGMVVAFGKKHRVPPENWVFDMGGGGKQIADNLRANRDDAAYPYGYQVVTIPFGATVSADIKIGMHTLSDRKDIAEERYTYCNRRAQMFWETRLMLDPEGMEDEVVSGLRHDKHQIHKVSLFNRDTKRTSISYINDLPRGWGIPKELVELRRQMSKIPIRYDNEGRLKMLPKNKRNPDSKEETLTELLKCSPDELDSVVLAVHHMIHMSNKPKVGRLL